MISVEVTVVVVVEVGVAGGGCVEQALEPKTAAAAARTTMDFSISVECPVP
jgi:hypothetical protein